MIRMLAIAAVAVTAGGSTPDVTVREADGAYAVSARFTVAHPPAAVLAVLTDYERIPRFMPGIKTSIVRERSGERVVVEQEAASGFLAFTKRVHLVLEITHGADTLQFRDRCGRSFATYEGRWRLTERNGGTEVVYELLARPAFDVPEFFLTRVLRRDSARMIEQLRRQVAAEAAR